MAAPNYLKALPPRREMHAALVAGDTSYEGAFLAAIHTTQILCRPRCLARKQYLVDLKKRPYSSGRD